MVMPLRDDTTDRHTVPVVTYAFIGVNILVWLIELNLGEQFIHMPAFVVPGVWIVLQVFSQISVVGGSGGGVANMAHIGGFVAGLALIFVLGKRASTVAEMPR
jgi:membrane associated rhomboid family serine protease